jgi:hypothetical protein
MNRSDERKQTGASLARSPSEARRREEPIADEKVSSEPDDAMDEHESEDSSMARTPAAAKRGAVRHEHEERSIEGKHHDSVSGGREIMHESVDADHVIGVGGRVGTASAEGEPDMASAKANRKEAGEPEREENEKAAMGKERSVAAKNVIGHGERETVAKHTI